MTFIELSLSPKTESEYYPGYPDFNPVYEYDTNNGYIVNKITGEKRKFFEELTVVAKSDFRTHVKFWSPRLQNLERCEKLRWKALQYYTLQKNKISDIFVEVQKNAPFYCVSVDSFLRHRWLKIYNSNDFKEVKAVAALDKKHNIPINQTLGNSWFYYLERNKILDFRLHLFQLLFTLAVRAKFLDFSRSLPKDFKIKVKLNERDYIIGIDQNDDFGVIVYPEQVVDAEILDNKHKGLLTEDLLKV